VEYPAIAAVLAAESPGWSATAVELAYADTTRDPAHHHATVVAINQTAEGALMVGVAFVGHDALAHRPGKFEINLRVRPDWQGCGVGKGLYDAVLDHLAPLAPEELFATIWHKVPRTARFLTERGFAEAWRRTDWVLDVPTFDFTPYAGLDKQLLGQGIAIKPYIELAVDSNRLTKLHELDWAIWQSIPYGQAVTKRTLEQFAAQEIDHPKFIPAACFIAVKDGEYLGYSNLIESDDGFSTEMTGVLPAWRGRGIATALKLAGIRYAQAHNAQRLDTQNDAVNQAMIALNQKLGFVAEGANLRFVKKMP
jgi:GNAT superfamily N-acetyltransferase